jgi:two-component system cell cycle sensor histidine kinase/response regulator CckA
MDAQDDDGPVPPPKRPEQTLLEREAGLRAILESAVDAIVTMDDRGAIQSFNPAAERLFGYGQDEVLGRNVNMLMPSPYREEHDGYVASYVSTGKAKIIGSGREVEAKRKTGEVFPIHLSVGEARLGDRQIFTGIIRDLTARKRLEEQLAQSQKMEAVGRLAGGVAHDFNNILLTILGRSDAMLRRMPRHDPLRRQVNEIRKAGRRAAALTKQLLAVSRSQVLSPQLVDLNAVLRDTAEMLRRLIGEDVEFRMELDPALGAVKVDPHQIVQVVLNLVVNARDAMPRGGTLLIETRNVDSSEADLPGNAVPAVLVAVRDTGLGMDASTQARIFEPYFTTKGERGTGLGLSTVYGIVKQSRGTIRVDSRPEQGSTFSVYLPREEGRAQPTAEPRRKKVQHRKGGRILLVEDDRAARSALEEFLQEDGHTVLSAGDGDEAERLCAEASEPVDLVVTDTVMPRMSGPQLVARLRELQPGLKAILMSGHTPETVLQHGQTPGHEAVFLQKPFEIDDLLSHVRTLLGSRSSAAGRKRPDDRSGSRRRP